MSCPTSWSGAAGRGGERHRLAQPLLFSLEYALAGLLGHYGLRPAALLGHSLGELTAACLAGVFDLTEALALVAERGRLMAGMPPGSMLAAALGEAEAAGLVAARPGLALAAVNGPRAVTLAGPSGLVAATARELADRGVAVHPLATSHAFHSAAMAPAAESGPLRGRAPPRAPRVPVYGNPAAGRGPPRMGDPGYWARQMLARCDSGGPGRPRLGGTWRWRWDRGGRWPGWRGRRE